MLLSFRAVSLPALPLEMRKSLSPYVESLEDIIVPAVRSFRTVPRSRKTVGQITRRIGALLQDRMGHNVHPAIICYALRVSCHETISRIDRAGSPAEQRAQIQLLDRAYELVETISRQCGAADYLILEL
jgi:hypothetical protein